MTIKLMFLMRDGLPPFRPDVAVLFGKELPKLGVCSDLLGQQAPESEGGADWPAGRLFVHGRIRQGLLSDALRPLHDLAMVWRLRSEHRIVQVRDKIRSGVLGLLVARLSGRPFTFWMSFPMAEGFRIRTEQVGRERGLLVLALNRLRAVMADRVFYKWLAPRADHLFVQSDTMLDFMAERGVSRQRMTAVPMGVDHEVFAAVSAPVRRPAELDGRRVLAYLGVMGRVRESDFLLDVLRRVREEEPTTMLLLLGDGASPDEQAWLRERIAASGLSAHVWLTGWLPQEQALSLLKCADLGLSPIPRGVLFDVSSPTKAVEYLALGLPCVGNDVPDQRQVLESSGAGLCVPMQVNAFAGACLRLLRDEAGAATMARLGPPWVAAHRSYAMLAAQVAQSYEGLLRRRPAR